MSTEQEKNNQPENHHLTILDDEEREAVVQPFINSMNAEATECFADFLITLINETHKRPSDARRVEQELLAALERTFRHSKAYELALDLYASRFEFVPGKVSITGFNLEEMLAEIKRNRVTERKEAAPAQWAIEFGSTVGRLLKDDKLSELSYISLRDPLIELVSNGDHHIGSLGLAMLPFVLTKFFAKMPAPKIIVLITAADARNPKEPIEMGRLTQGDVWEDFEKLLTDLDKLLPSMDVEQYHPLTIALEREDGARYIVYRREVADSLVEKLFDYAEEHLEVESSIRRAPGSQASERAFEQLTAESQLSGGEITGERITTLPIALTDWIERFSQVIAEAIDNDVLPKEARNNLADVVVEITNDYANNVSDHVRYLLPVALQRFNAQSERQAVEPVEQARQAAASPISEVQATPSNWIDLLGPMIAEALESGELPSETQTALEDFVVNITDEHASGYADQARHLLALGLRRLIANPPEDAEAEDDADDTEDNDDAEAVPRPAPHNMIFNLCDYQYLRLDFLLSEGGDKVFSFSLQRDPSTRDSSKGNADVCFYTFGERDASYMYEGLYLRKHEGAIEHTVSIVITGEGKVQFCGYKDVLLFSLYWEKEGDSLDGGFDVFDNTGLTQSLEFSMEA